MKKQIVKPKYLYHGSRKKMIGNKLEPRKAGGLGKKLENKQTGIYSTDKRDFAIIMGIISGAKLSGMNFQKGKGEGIIYEGWPKRKEIYLYYFPPESFIKIKGDNWQWRSYKLLNPIKVEKLQIKDYIHLIRKATDKEKEIWFKKHKDELRNLKT